MPRRIPRVTLAAVPDLFLSHSSSDVDAVRRLRVYLEAGGYSCWMAPDDVSSSRPWAEQIVDAIRTSRAMVVVLSERSIGSEHVSREVGLAVQAGRAASRDQAGPRAAGGSSLVARAGVVGGGVMVAVGSVLPWSTLSIGGDASSVSGIDREGVGLITAVLGIGLVVLGLLGLVASGGRARVVGFLVIVVSVLAGLMGIAEALHQRELDVAAEGVTMSLGVGLFMLVAGAAIAGLSGVALAVGRRVPPSGR